ncbi:MAG: serine/threonine-protein kinase [Xanthomonadales bacterium]|nr:serine/threonine-protein kinase [Xanthomonadales bacterium]
MDHDPPKDGQNPDWQDIATAFDALADMAPADRRQALTSLQQSDPTMADELESLLASLESDPEFLQRPAVDLQQSGSRGLTQIGPYRVLDRLGRGGMGTVYRARRDDGRLDQVVAIKLVRAAAGDPMRLQRFAQEARLLSRLDHPGIARPLDAGTLDDDAAYLVMEYVDGIPVDRYCREKKLSRQSRLELLLRICEAVQFAHQNLVVHRDIKPANVLVDDSGQPRLLDFGIARMLEASDEPGLTITGQIALTPNYASPEQFAQEPVTTASDVYALGVLACELLTGKLPLSLEGLALPDVIDTVRSRPPLPPSEAGGDPALRGDLDAIVLMALRKEPERRYASAAEFAADIRRYLSGQPVVAHPDTLGYRVGKFLRRHRLAVGAGAAVILALAGLSGFATVQAIRANEARTLAEQETRRATEVLGFFQDMLASADPARSQGEAYTVRDLLDQTASGLADAELDPLVLATVQETVASTYLSLGLPDSGVTLAAAASGQLEQILGADDPRTLAARHAEARFHLYMGNYQQAIEILEPTLDGRRRVLGDSMDTMSTLHNLAIAYAETGEVERALEMDLIQLEIVEQLSGKGSPEALTTMISVGHGYYALGRLDEALDLFQQVYLGQRGHLGDKHPTVLSALHNYATLSRQVGQVDQAESLFLQLVDRRREILGDRHAQTLNTVHNLGELYLAKGDHESAATYLEEALAGRRQALGGDHPDVIDSMVAYARLQLARGDPEAAESNARQAVLLGERVLNPEAGTLQKAREVLAAALLESASDAD